MMLKKNKKGEKLISLYWFLVLTIIAGGIMIMVNVFYGAPYDIREMEASLLAEHVINCISPDGKMNSLLISPIGTRIEEFRDHFSDRCNLNFAGHQEWEAVEYYVQAKLYIRGEKNPFMNLTYGNQNWVPQCKEDKQLKGMPVCFEKKYYSYDSGKKVYQIEILTAVGKIKDNVK